MKEIVKNIVLVIAYCILSIIKLPFTIAVAIIHTIEVWLIIAMAKLMTFSTMKKFKYGLGIVMENNAEGYRGIYYKMDDLADELKEDLES